MLGSILNSELANIKHRNVENMALVERGKHSIRERVVIHRMRAETRQNSARNMPVGDSRFLLYGAHGI